MRPGRVTRRPTLTILPTPSRGPSAPSASRWGSHVRYGTYKITVHVTVFIYRNHKSILSPTRPLVAYSPLTLASLRMLPCRTHCPLPSMCIMYGCGTACGTTLFARYCHVTPRQKPPKVGSGGFGDGAPPGAVRAWIGLSGRFLALAICPRRAPHAGIRGYGPRRLR